MGRPRINRVGETFFSNEGCNFEIVQYNTGKSVIIRFLDEYGAEVHTTYHNCKRGTVKNPYFKSIYNIGCLGLKSDGTKPTTKVDGRHTKEYACWHRMMERCYSSACHLRKPSYLEATVCDRWLVFANFLEDLPKIKGYNLWIKANPSQYVLDKDLHGNGSKIYSLETCCFVTVQENSKEVVARCGIPQHGRMVKY